MATKNKKTYIFIEVLQNGSPLCEIKRPLNKKSTITLGMKKNSTIQIPYYPFTQKIILAKVKRKIVSLYVGAHWEGFISRKKEMSEFTGTNQHATIHKLANNDYGSLAFRDVQVLIRLGKEHSVNSVKKVRSGQFFPKIFSLVTNSGIEAKVLVAAIIIAGIITAAAGSLLDSKNASRPSNVEDLPELYALSFINPSHFINAPEALQEKINRSNYVHSVSQYINSYISMLMGWEIENKNLLFKSSIAHHKKLQQEQAEKISTLRSEQERINATTLNKKYSAVISIPSVEGESLSENVSSLLKNIAEMNDSLAFTLQSRRETQALFTQDTEYDFRDYLSKKKSNEVKQRQAARDNLSKVSPFNLLTDEQAMYREAIDYGKKAYVAQKQIYGSSLPGDVAQDDVYILGGVNYVSFLQEQAFSIDDKKINELRSVYYKIKKTRESIQEPLIGEINPNLVKKVISKNQYDLQLCYELALRRNGQAKGRMQWRWRIDTRGKPSDIALVSSAIKDEPMKRCVRKKIAKWSFPRPKRGSVEVEYPFFFSKSKG